MIENKERLIFDFPDESTELVDVIYNILNTYNLRPKEDSLVSPKEPEKSQVLTIIDATFDIFNKKSREEVSISLQKYLGVTPEVAEKIITDIEKDLVPCIKINTPETNVVKEESVQDIILEKIKQGQENAQQPSAEPINKESTIPNLQEKYNEPFPSIKKIAIKNVEENAEISQENKLYTDDVKKVIQEAAEEGRPEKEKFKESKFEDEKKGPDSYREPIEE